MTTLVAVLRRRLAGDPEGGSTTLEVVIWTPAILLLLGALVLAGRVQLAAGAVEHAAFTAARDASLAREPATARAAATSAADRELAAQDIHCTTTAVTIDTSGFTAPIGTPATVTASLTCKLEFADFAIPGLPGTRTVTATATSPLDQWRTR